MMLLLAMVTVGESDKWRLPSGVKDPPGWRGRCNYDRHKGYLSVVVRSPCLQQHRRGATRTVRPQGRSIAEDFARAISSLVDE